MATADSVLSEMKGHLKVAAGREHPTVERAIEAAARALDIPFRRAWGIWYGKARQILAHEADNIRQRAALVRAREIEKSRATLARLEAEYAALTSELEGAGSPDVGGDQDSAVAAEAAPARGEIVGSELPQKDPALATKPPAESKTRRRAARRRA